MIRSLGFQIPLLKRNRNSVHKCDSITTGAEPGPAIRAISAGSPTAEVAVEAGGGGGIVCGGLCCVAAGVVQAYGAGSLGTLPDMEVSGRRAGREGDVVQSAWGG